METNLATTTTRSLTTPLTASALALLLLTSACGGQQDNELTVGQLKQKVIRTVPSATQHAPDKIFAPKVAPPEAKSEDTRLLNLQIDWKKFLKRTPSCRASDLTFTRWPADGVHGRDWMIHNYTDLDSVANAKTDFMGFTGSLARNYDGHKGLDIDIPSFRQMDDDSAVIRAPAPGVVTMMEHHRYDRNTTFVGGWNVVKVLHANGFKTTYGHIKKWSARVAVGDHVVAGQVLAVMGSSGKSSAPHLHFSVVDCDGNWLESFDQMWQSPPAYDAPSGIMELVVKDGHIIHPNQIKDPAPNATTLKAGTQMGVGLSLATRQGDQISVTLVPLYGGQPEVYNWTVGGNARYRHLYPSWYMTVGNTTGKWAVMVSLNGILQHFHIYNVVP